MSWLRCANLQPQIGATGCRGTLTLSQPTATVENAPDVETRCTSSAELFLDNQKA